MGYDIAFYVVKQTAEGGSRYQLYPPVLRGSVVTSARAYQWQDVMFFHHAPDHQLTDLNLHWLKYQKDTPEEWDEFAPDQSFDGTDLVFDPQLILQDVVQVQHHIQTYDDHLPWNYGYQVHHADPEKIDLRQAFWMWKGGELWCFQSGWSHCEGHPTTIQVHSPGWTEQHHEATLDASRTLHGWEFPEGGLEGFVLPTYGNLLPEILQALKMVQKREHQGDAPERVTVHKYSYAEHHACLLNSLIKVCEFALQNGCGVLVHHSY